MKTRFGIAIALSLTILIAFGVSQPPAGNHLALDMLALTQHELTVTNGVNVDVPVAGISNLRVEGATAPFSIASFAGGVSGQMLVFENSGGQTVTFKHNTQTGDPLNRIFILSQQDLVIASPVGSITVFKYVAYDGTGIWVPISHTP